MSIFCTQFWQVLLARIGFAIFMSFCIPTSVSLITDYFDHEELGRANSVFTFGVYMGVGLSSLTIIIDKKYGWKNSLLFISVACFFFAFLTVFLKEPRVFKHRKARRPTIHPTQSYHSAESLRRSMAKTPQPSFMEKMKTVFSSKCFVYLILGSAFRFMGGYSIGFWGETFFDKVYHDHQKTYAYMNVVVEVLGGLPGSYMGGYLGDILEESYPRIKGQIAGYGALGAIPFIWMCYLGQWNFWVSIITLYISFWLAEAWYGPSHAVINVIFPIQYQGVAVAIYNLVGAFTGGLATFLLGYLGDVFNIKVNNAVTGYLMALFITISYGGCAPFFLLMGKEYEKFLNKAK